MEDIANQCRFGVFAPVGHVLVSFASRAQAGAAAEALRRAVNAGDDVRHLSDREMLELCQRDVEPSHPRALKSPPNARFRRASSWFASKDAATNSVI